jgi:phosphoglycerate dehydrogenase-like enzyme
MLRVVIATPLSDENVAVLAEREPRLEIVHEPSLMAPAGADWMVAHQRTDDEQRRYDELVDSAEALYGVPDQSGKALARTVAANPGLRWVHTIPAGGGQQIKAARLPQDALERIVFSTSAGVHAEPLAEFALFGVLAGAKLLPYLSAAQQRHEWAPRRLMGIARDMTVAVVGLGGIGRATAAKLDALGYRVIGVHRRQVDVPGVAEILPVERLAEAAARADAIVLALPGTDQTREMLGAEVLAAVRPGITIVNVGRGTTIDEEALVAALEDGRVGFAALDVTYVEPLPAESPLWGLPNVLISPHTAAISEHEPRLIAELFAENAGRLLDGEPLKNRVNTVEFY